MFMQVTSPIVLYASGSVSDQTRQQSLNLTLPETMTFSSRFHVHFHACKFRLFASLNGTDDKLTSRHQLWYQNPNNNLVSGLSFCLENVAESMNIACRIVVVATHFKCVRIK